MKRNNLVDLYQESETTCIFYDVAERTLWRVDNSVPRPSVSIIITCVLLFAGYLVWPYYSSNRTYAGDGVVIALSCFVSVWLVFYSGFNNRRFETKQWAFGVTRLQLRDMLPQIKKRYRTQLWLLAIGVLCCAVAVPLFFRCHGFSFAVLNSIGTSLICSFLQVSGMFRKKRVIRQISQDTLPIDIK